MRENTRALTDRSYQDLNNALRLQDDWFRDASFADLYIRAAENRAKLSDVEFQQYKRWAAGNFGICESAYRRLQSYWALYIPHCAKVLSGDTDKHIWLENRHVYLPEFRAWADTTVQKLHGREGAD